MHAKNVGFDSNYRMVYLINLICNHLYKYQFITM